MVVELMPLLIIVFFFSKNIQHDLPFWCCHAHIVLEESTKWEFLCLLFVATNVGGEF